MPIATPGSTEIAQNEYVHHPKQKHLRGGRTIGCSMSLKNAISGEVTGQEERLLILAPGVCWWHRTGSVRRNLSQ